MTRRREAVGLGVLCATALAAYLALMQHCAAFDGATILLTVRNGAYSADCNFLYLPILSAWQSLLRPLGTSDFTASAALSAVSVAAGVGIAHAASRAIGDGPKRSLATAALVATCPAVMFWATVVENHGPFLPFAMLAIWIAARMCARPSHRLAIALGLATGLANAVHASGILLPVPLLGMFLVHRSALGARALRIAASAALVHSACVAAAPYLIGALVGIPFSARGAFERFAAFAADHPVTVALVAGHIAREWLWSFAPLSVLWLFALRRPELRATSLSLGAALLVYLAANYLMLGRAFGFGAYLLPLVWPAARCTAGCLPLRFVVVAAVLGAAIGAAQIRVHDAAEPPRSYADGVQELAEGHPVLLLTGSEQDREACVVTLPQTEFLFVPELLELDADVLERNLGALARNLEERIRAGDRVYLTSGAEELLRANPLCRDLPAAHLLLDCFARAFEMRPVARAGFRGFDLRAR